MPPQSEWSELLEEQAYLVQLLSEVAHDSGALENTRTLLDTLRADLRVCTIQVADFEREGRDSSPKRQDAKITSSASRFIHRVTGSIGSDKDKEKEKAKEKEKENYVLGETERLLAVWIKKRTLGAEVKNLEVRTQILQRRNRHYVELQRRLTAVYARIPAGKGSSSREEEDAEDITRRAQLTLHEVQRLHDRYMVLVALLQQGDYALINAAHHLSAANSKVGSGIDAAKRCAVQTAVVVDQAKRIDPLFFEQDETEVLKAGWLAEVFRTTSADDQYGALLIQALKPHHTALLSLISRAHKRASEHDSASRRAALQYSDAKAQRDSLKRGILLKCATAEAETNGDMSFVDPGPEKDGLTRMRDITAGLAGLIPAVVPPRGSVSASPSESTDERPRVAQDKLVPPLPPLASPQPRSSLQLLSSTLMQDPANTLSSIPSSSTKSGIDPRPDPQLGSVEKRSRRASPAVRQTPSPNASRNQSPSTDPDVRQRSFADSTLRQPALLDLTMRKRQPSPRQSREAPGAQNDQQRGPSPLYQSEFASTRPSGRGDAIPLAQAPPRRAQPMYRDVPPLIVVPKQSSQQDVKTPQPSASMTSNRNSDPHYPLPASISNVKSGTASPYQVTPRSSAQPQPQPQPPRQQAQLGPPQPTREPYPDALGLRPDRSSSSTIAEGGRPQLSVVSGSSHAVSDPTQVTSQVPSATNPLLERPAVHSILKHPPAPAPRRAAAAGVDTDPWGVKVASASSSRSQPKLKAMFNLLRSADGFKHDDPAGAVRAPAPSEPQPRTPSPKRENPRAAMQSLRFAEGVQFIPRPAVDSDPYEDEDEGEVEELPPSPRRGSVLWLQGPEARVEEDNDDVGGHGYAQTQSTATQALNPSESSISSTSSSYSTQQSTQMPSPASSLTTPPSSAISAHSDSSLVSYYTTRKDDRTPMNHPTTASHLHQASRQMSYGSVQSDHELVQSIFPSPAQSNISERDLLFGP